MDSGGRSSNRPYSDPRVEKSRKKTFELFRLEGYR